MDLRQFEYIVTIADEGSISKAASKLYLAQPSLSQYLNSFEKELGGQLFIRTAKGVRPTPSGKIFLEHARKILNQYRKAQSEFWDAEEIAGGEIAFGISTYRGTYLLPNVLKQFKDLYPQVHVIITERDSRILEDLLLEGKLDLAVIASPSAKIKDNVECLLQDEIMIVASDSHPVMGKVHRNDNNTMWVNLKDTEQFEYVLGPPDTIQGKTLREAFAAEMMRPIVYNSSITSSLAVGMARTGSCLAVTYRSCIERKKGTNYLRIGKEGIFVDVSLAYAKDEYKSKATKELSHLMLKYFKMELEQ